jgi:chaperone BCS1
MLSSFGEERINIFTTNYRERLDPALLALTYLGIEDHGFFKCIEDLIQRISVTPAEVSQQLKKCNKTQGAIESLIEFPNMEEESAEEDNDTEDEMIFFLNQAGPFPACHFKYRLHSNFPVEFA